MRSIRNFLVIVLLAAVTLINFLAALHGYRSSLAAANELFDIELVQLADLLALGRPLPGPDRTVANPDTSIAYQIWQGDKLFLRSDNAPVRMIAPREAGFHDVNFSRYRWRSIVVEPTADSGRWIMVAERIDRRFQLAEKVIIESVVPIVACLPLIGLIIWLVVGRGLQPLQQLAGQLRRKRPEDLSPVNNTADTAELRQMVSSVNDLLGRLAAAFQREQRFAANAAHELRTPVSVLKVHLYNLEQELGGEHDTFRQLDEGLNRLGHLVEQILALHMNSRESGYAALESCDLVALSREVISDCYENFQLKDQDIELRGAPSVLLDCYPLAIKTLLSNLIINASKYTPRQGQVRVTVNQFGERAVLVVEDSGPGISEEERERVFERFYRSGGDRHGSGELGCGLGLSIAKQVVDSHGGDIKLGVSDDLGGLRVEVLFSRENLDS